MAETAIIEARRDTSERLNTCKERNVSFNDIVEGVNMLDVTEGSNS